MSEKTFGTADQALSWAYYFLKDYRGKVQGSAFQRSMADAVNMGRKALYKTLHIGDGESEEDLYLKALTIAAVAERIQPEPAKHVVHFMFAGPVSHHLHVLAGMLFQRSRELGYPRNLHPLVLTNIMRCILLNQREWVTGKRWEDVPDAKRLSRILGIRYNVFSRKGTGILQRTQEQLRIWQDVGMRELTDELVDKGLVK